MTNLDGLDEMKTIKICTAYRLGDQILEFPPALIEEWEACEPIYEELPGWKGEDITECRSFEELPANAQAYVKHLEDICNVRISFVSVGPDRDQTIVRDWYRDED